MIEMIRKYWKEILCVVMICCVGILLPGGRNGFASILDSVSQGIVSKEVPSHPGPVREGGGLPEAGEQVPDLFRTAVRMGAALILIIGVILIFSYGMRRMLHRQGNLGGKETVIRVLASRYLGAKNSLSVIDVGGERFVIGVSPQRITFLTRVPGESTDEVSSGRDPSFQHVLRRSLHDR